MLLLVGCLSAPDPAPVVSQPDEYLPTVVGELRQVWFTFPGETEPTHITVEVDDGLLIIQGDMIIGHEADLDSQGGMTGQSLSVKAASTRWPRTGGAGAAEPYTYTVPFEIDEDFSQSFVQLIEDAMDHWEQNTNLRFVKRTSEVDYVFFEALPVGKNRCLASVGRRGGKQTVRLRESHCRSLATVVHEIGHAVGLQHEHSRSDRDTFVTIINDNIEPEERGHNFNVTTHGLDVGPYDYASVMHYSRCAFGLTVPARDADCVWAGQSEGRLETITTPNGEAFGGAVGLSRGDIEAVRRMYPERELPFVSIRLPGSDEEVNEGRLVNFSADVVTDVEGPNTDPENITIYWSYINHAGVPVAFGDTETGEEMPQAFCDGEMVVTATAYYGATLIGADSVNLTVTDLGATNPPAMCDIRIHITAPLDGAVYSTAVPVPLRAQITNDRSGPPELLYPVEWRLNDPDTGPLIAVNTLSTSVSFPAGEYTIYANYGAGRDSHSFTVAEAGNPPTVTITTPADGALFTWTDHGDANGIDIRFQAIVNDAEDGPLTGTSLVWEVRRLDQAEFVFRANGTNPVIRFIYYTSGGQSLAHYDVRLTVTDSDGMVSTDQIRVGILSPPP